MKVLVTGASGFVGRTLCPFLELRGDEVVQAVRRVTSPRHTLVGEVDSSTNWRTVLEGVEAVVHLAARVHIMHDGPNAEVQYDRVNHWGTVNLAMQAAEVGVRRFVFVSTVKVLGESGSFSGRSVPAPGDAYSLSKWEAEKALRTVAQNTGLEVAILRPPLVHGPGVGANIARLSSWVKRGIPLPFGAVSNQRSLLGVANLAHAIGCLLTHPNAVGKTYLLSDGVPVSTSELIRLLAQALGVRPRLFPVPPELLQGMGKLLGRGDEMDRLLGSLVVDDHAIRQELGWSPLYTLAEGLRLMIE